MIAAVETQPLVPSEPAPVSPGVHRIEQLDSLRGLAALIVFFGHSAAVLNSPSPAAQRVGYWIGVLPTRFFLDGHSAVLFFFLLSGFVLYLPFAKPHPPTYRAYITRRVCRIYLPYLLAIAYAGTVSWLTYRPLPHTGSLFAWQPQTLRQALHRFPAYASLILPFNHSDWNSSSWSVSEEMRVSLIFPLLAWFVRRLPWRSALLLAVAAPFTAALLIAKFHHFYPFMTLHYAGVFVIGSLLAKHREQLREKLQRVGLFPLWVALAVITYAPYAQLLVPAKIAEATSDLLLTAGCGVLLIASLTFMRFRAWLLSRPVLKFGSMSYSFYLYHMPTLFMCACLFWVSLGPAATYAIAFVTTLAITIVAYKYVELPSIALGRYLTHTRMRPAHQG